MILTPDDVDDREAASDSLWKMTMKWRKKHSHMSYKELATVFLLNSVKIGLMFESEGELAYNFLAALEVFRKEETER